MAQSKAVALVVCFHVCNCFSSLLSSWGINSFSEGLLLLEGIAPIPVVMVEQLAEVALPLV